jgi:nitroimidazol reductase NimA-like FMN-containing flavoprotein (pyridoxamine 5'-phosphate oxidase superfamily)
VSRADDPVGAVRAIVDANGFMTLATAGADGTPWASPVWFAHAAYTEFVWVSRPEARHSRNLAERPSLAIVIFDSTVVAGEGQAVYLEATAEEVTGEEREGAMEIFSSRSVATGLRAWSVADVTGPASHRLYRATASAWYVLGETDRRVPVQLTRTRTIDAER